MHLNRDGWQAQAELLRSQKSLFSNQVLDYCCHVDNVVACQEGLVSRGRDPVMEFQNWGGGGARCRWDWEENDPGL